MSPTRLLAFLLALGEGLDIGDQVFYICRHLKTRERHLGLGFLLAYPVCDISFRLGDISRESSDVSDQPGMVAGWMIIDDDQLQHMEFREHGFISNLFVNPDRRGKDIAQHLLYAMEQHLIVSGARGLSVRALARNGPAIAAYQTFDFEPFEITLEKYLK